MRVERPGQPDGPGRDRKGADLERLHVLAGHRRHLLVVAYRAQHAAEGRGAQPLGQHIGDCDDDRDERQVQHVELRRRDLATPRAGDARQPFSVPLVSQIVLELITRIVSAKPSVTIAK